MPEYVNERFDRVTSDLVFKFLSKLPIASKVPSCGFFTQKAGERWIMEQHLDVGARFVSNGATSNRAMASKLRKRGIFVRHGGRLGSGDIELYFIESHESVVLHFGGCRAEENIEYLSITLEMDADEVLAQILKPVTQKLPSQSDFFWYFNHKDHVHGFSHCFLMNHNTFETMIHLSSGSDGIRVKDEDSMRNVLACAWPTCDGEVAWVEGARRVMQAVEERRAEPYSEGVNKLDLTGPETWIEPYLPYKVSAVGRSVVNAKAHLLDMLQGVADAKVSLNSALWRENQALRERLATEVGNP